MAHAASSHTIWRGIGRFLEHTAAVILGFVMMVVGLGLGVTMVMLPFGLVIGLLGLAIFVSGLFMRLDEGKRP
jgi:membrane-bound ClpP family serine protease